MNLTQFCKYYFNKIKHNLPANANLSSIYNQSHDSDAEWGDKITIYYTYGKTKEGQLKRGSFDFIWGEILQQERDRKIDQLFD